MMSLQLKVLVVDDNQEFAQNVKDILELKGYSVVTVPDGFKALELAKGNGFDLVLMDVKMPVMDGVETFKKIKKILPQTPVIMVSAYAVEDLIAEALKEGAFGSLKKPLAFDHLFKLIERATGSGMMILVVDDDKELCSNLADVLNDRSYRVVTAYDGDVAIQKVRENKFDLILIDMKLPPLNGLETYLSIRNIRPDIIAIIITGYGQEMDELIKQALEKSAYTCLQKPIDMDKLLSLLAQIKERKAKK